MSKKILLVDDDHDVLDLLEVILFRRYDIVPALNGFEGLTKAQEVSPDLILTDIMMPIMDGIKFFNSLKKNPETASIPVVAITSFVERHPLKSLLSVGFKDVICKPFNKEDVIRTVQSLLGDEGQ